MCLLSQKACRLGEITGNHYKTEDGRPDRRGGRLASERSFARLLGGEQGLGQGVGNGLGVVSLNGDLHGVTLLNAQSHDGQNRAGGDGCAAFLAMVTLQPEAATA